jgi:hypothetical protein
MRGTFLSAVVVSLFSVGSEIAQARIVNQLSPDLMILRAEEIADLNTTSTSSIQLKDCDNHTRPDYSSWFDCTKALEKKYNAPALNSIYLKQDSSIECKIQRVKVLVKKIAMSSSSGIGFSHGRKGQGYNIKLLDRFSLKVIEQRTLGNQIPVFVYEFIGISSCQLDGVKASYQFRPFLTFQTQAGSRYRSWDKFGFYQIPPSDTGFDQSSQVENLINGNPSVGNTTTSGYQEVVEPEKAAKQEYNGYYNPDDDVPSSNE